MMQILQDRGHEVIVGQSRIDDYKTLEKEIRSTQPDRIFSSTGRTHGTYEGKYYGTIDFLELPGGLEKNLRDNLRGPVNLALICQHHGVHLTYIGTGCIFSYDQDHQMLEDREDHEGHRRPQNGFTEEDLPNFFGSGYSTIKGQTDILMHTFNKSVLNCRIRMPITGDTNPRNFITKITNYERICSIPNSMTVLPQILPIMAHMMESGETGTYNMTNPGVISHNQILDLYTEKVDANFTYKNFTLEEQAEILLSGRSNNYLDTTKLEAYCTSHDLKLLSIGDAVVAALDTWENAHEKSAKGGSCKPLQDTMTPEPL